MRVHDDVPQWDWVEFCMSEIDKKYNMLRQILIIEQENETISGEPQRHIVSQMYINEIAEAHAQLLIYGYAYDGVELSDVERISGTVYSQPKHFERWTI